MCQAARQEIVSGRIEPIKITVCGNEGIPAVPVKVVPICQNICQSENAVCGLSRQAVRKVSKPGRDFGAFITVRLDSVAANESEFIRGCRR